MLHRAASHIRPPCSWPSVEHRSKRVQPPDLRAGTWLVLLLRVRMGRSTAISLRLSPCYPLGFTAQRAAETRRTPDSARTIRCTAPTPRSPCRSRRSRRTSTTSPPTCRRRSRRRCTPARASRSAPTRSRPSSRRPHRAGDVRAALDRNPGRGARHLPPLPAEPDVPRARLRGGARHAGAHLLQVRARQPGRQPQAEHRDHAGVGEQAGRREAPGDRDRRRVSGAARSRAPASCSASSAWSTWCGSATTRSRTAA